MSKASPKPKPKVTLHTIRSRDEEIPDIMVWENHDNPGNRRHLIGRAIETGYGVRIIYDSGREVRVPWTSFQRWDSDQIDLDALDVH